jgi:hypothetical protein
VTNSWSEFQQIVILPGLGAGLAFVIVLALLAIVVFPAVWSKDAERRTAALVVLRLLLRHWSRRGPSRVSRGSRGERRKIDR